VDGKRAVRARDFEAAAEEGRTLAHAHQPVPAVRPRRALAEGVVADPQLEPRLAEGNLDPSRTPAVPGGIRKRLLEDPVRSLVDDALELPRLASFVRWTSSPAAAWRATSVSSDASPGGASTAPFSEPGSRRVPTIWSISPTVLRANSPIAANAACERSGSCRSRAVPARRAMTLIAWPAASWRSRAIRARSSAARRRSRSASSSPRRARSSSWAICSRLSRVRSPANHAAA
jgi:hypothetical protein